MSGPQFVNALTQSNTQSMCESSAAKDQRAELECSIRQKIKEVAEQASSCLSLNPQQCMQSSISGSALCQWAAQGANECGIDEEKLVTSLVGRWNLKHPLVRAVILHDKCSELGEQFCEANPDCKWQRGQGRRDAFCDMNPSTFFRMLITKPVILQLTQFVMSGAICRAEYEHGSPPMCKAPCVLQSGICRLDVDRLKPPNMFELLEVVCSKAAENYQDCPSPCVRSWQTRSCQRPARLPLGFDPEHMQLTREDMLVAEIFMVLQGATLVYEHQCNTMDEDPRACTASLPTCSADRTAHFMPANRKAGQIPDIPPTPGMKGALGNMLSSVTHGLASHNLSQFLVEHPEVVEKVTQRLGVPKVGEMIEKHPQAAAAATAAAAALGTGIGSILKRPAQPPPDSAPAPVPLAQGSDPIVPRPPPAQSEGLTELTNEMNDVAIEAAAGRSEAGDMSQWYSNPWTIAAGTTLSAAICAGIAMGALCHAQMFRSARAPLLVEEVMQDYEVAPLGSGS